MVRTAIILFLVSAFLMQPLAKLIILADYKLNQDYIANNLCENKSKPQMHCNGKCHLKKQLQKQDKKENSESFLKEKSELQFFSRTNFKFKKTCKVISKPSTIQNEFKPYCKHISSVFHPPPFLI